VQGLAISLRINRNGFDIEFTAGSGNSHRDFTAIGYQDAFKHV
jgi:hypothetical protein